MVRLFSWIINNCYDRLPNSYCCSSIIWKSIANASFRLILFSSALLVSSSDVSPVQQLLPDAESVNDNFGTFLQQRFPGGLDQKDQIGWTSSCLAGLIGEGDRDYIHGFKRIAQQAEKL